MKTDFRTGKFVNMWQNIATDDAMNNGKLYDYPASAVVMQGKTATGEFKPQKYGYLIEINGKKMCRDIERIDEDTLKLLPRNPKYPTETISTANVTGIWHIDKISF